MCCPCLKKISKKTCKIIGIVTITIASLFVLLVVIVPILGRKAYSTDYIIKSNPAMDNTNLWAKFPGDLKSTLKHNFIFFDYDQKSNKTSLRVYKNITLDENIAYSQFKQGEDGKSIYFFNNRTFSTKDDLNISSSMDNINLGMFEAFETMAYPPIYKLGINSIYYLTQKYFLEEDLFIKLLFTYNIKKQLTDDDYKNILSGIPDYLQSKILDEENEPYKTYSLKTNPGFFEWIKILGSNEKVKAANWLEEIFSLDEAQRNSILLNDRNLLAEKYKEYKKKIVDDFKCEESKCAEELLYKQLIESSVISKATGDSSINSFKKLNDYLGLDIYPFDKSPEMKDFNLQVSFTKDQLKRFLDKNGDSCLLSFENTIKLLSQNKTGDDKETYYKDLSYAQINFLAEYFYKSLPKAFLYPNINIEPDEGVNGTKSYGLLSKLVSNFLPEVAESTYDKIKQIQLLEHIDKNVPYIRLKEKLNVGDLNEFCSKFYKQVTEDDTIIGQICSIPSLNLKNADSFYKYYRYYYCQDYTKDMLKCDKEIEDTLTGKLSDENIKALFKKDSEIDKVIVQYNADMIKTYKCSGQCTNDYLLKIQFAKATVTRNALSPLERKDGLRGWFTDLKDDYEIINILKNNDVDIDFKEEDAFYIIDTKVKEGDILDLDNSKMFKNKIKFEKEYMNGLINKKPEEYSSLVKLTNFLFGLLVFDNNNNDLIVDYQSVDKFLQGEYSKSTYWIDKIKKGNYYENFNPKIEKLTKFDFGFNFTNGTQNDIDFDYIGINSEGDKLEKRRFVKMNDLLTLNIKKTEYDSLKDSLVNLNIPLFNLEKLLDAKFFSDGFQYDYRLDLIYYFDYISSRPMVFVKGPEDGYYKERLECKKYILDETDYTSKINEIFDRDSKVLYMTQKTNKPFILDPSIDTLSKFGYDPGKKLENYICVDPFSHMVIDSKIQFVYSIDSRKYGLLNKNIELNAKYPLFLYSKSYGVDLDSYEENYPGAADYYVTNFAFLIIGVLIVIFFSTFALIAFNQVHKQDKEDKKDLTKVIGDELGEGTEKLKNDADPDNENNDDDEIERLRVQNEIQNANNNENENENDKDSGNEKLIENDNN